MRRMIDRVGRVALFAAATPLLLWETLRDVSRFRVELDAARASAARSDGEMDEVRRRERRLEHAVSARDESLRLLGFETQSEIARLRGTVEGLGERLHVAQASASAESYEHAKTKEAMSEAEVAILSLRRTVEGMQRVENELRAEYGKVRQERDTALFEAKTADEILTHSRAACEDLKARLASETERADAAERHVTRAMKDGGEAVKGWTKVGQEADALRARVTELEGIADSLRGRTTCPECVKASAIDAEERLGPVVSGGPRSPSAVMPAECCPLCWHGPGLGCENRRSCPCHLPEMP